MRVITIDNGNTNPHAGIFENGTLVSVIPLGEFQPQDNDFLIASDVGAPLTVKLSVDLKARRHTKANPQFLGMPVHYAETLGDDRLFSAWYVFKTRQSPEERTLLIDAGTFITIDLITAKGFEGGWIFPGVKTFLQSYGKGTQLPVLENQKTASAGLAHTTEDAILGAKDIYLESVLKGTIEKTMPSKIMITGGSSEIIKTILQKISSKVLLESDPHLIHSALFLIQQSLLHQA